MYTPPPNFNEPRPPRDQDEWIAVLVALGAIGATAGWILFGGLPSVRLGAANADLTDAAADFPNIGLLEGAAEDDIDAAEDLDTRRRDVDGSLLDESAELEGTSARGRTLFESDSDPDRSLRSNAVPSTLEADTDTDTELNNAEPIAPPEDTAEPEVESSVVVPEPAVPESTSPDTLAVTRDPLSFSDVPADYWAKPYIDALTARGILNGLPDGSFAPERSMTRAELAAQVAEAFEFEPEQSTLPFTDVTDDYWASAQIDEAVVTGFMKGFPDQTFEPSRTVPRVQVLVTFATGLTLPNVATPAEQLQTYGDAAAVPNWATNKVASALAADIVINPPDELNQLRPNEDATRAEVAAILHEALVYMGKLEPVE